MPGNSENDEATLRQLLHDCNLGQVDVHDSNREKSYFDVPLDNNERFVQRDSSNRALEEALDPTRRPHKGYVRVVLMGTGGCGKTELALRFVENHRHDYKAIFWLDCSSTVLFSQSLSRMSDILTQKRQTPATTSLRNCQEWLCSNQNWLLVADKMDDNDMINHFRNDFMQEGMRGSLLVTSRNETLGTFWDAVKLGTMTEAEGSNLLHNIIGSEAFSQASIESVNDLIRCLGYLPLAIDQASSYMLQQAVSVDEYKNMFLEERERRRPLSVASLSRPHPDDAHSLVWTTWVLSYEKLQEIDEKASRLLLFLTLLDYNSISLDLLVPKEPGQRYWAPNGEFLPVDKAEKWIVPDLADVFSNRTKLTEALTMLHTYSFLRWGGSKSYFTIHHLIQNWAYEKLHGNWGQLKAMKRCAIGVISSQFEKQDLLPPAAIPSSHSTIGKDKGGTLQLWPWRRYQHLVSHALKCITYVLELDEVDEVVATQGLSFLQILDYADSDHVLTYYERRAYAFRIIEFFEENVMRGLIPIDDDGFLAQSIWTWSVLVTLSCTCRKRPGARCEQCFKIYKSFRWTPRSRSYPSHSPRKKAMLINWRTVFRVCSPEFGFAGRNSVAEMSPVEEGSWIETYAQATKDYYKILRTKHTASLETTLECSSAFTSLLPGSEESRRSLWHLTSAHRAEQNWQAVADILESLVEQSIACPCPTWYHERCVIRLIVAFLKLEDRSRAARCLGRVRDAYANCGVTLKILERSALSDTLGGGEHLDLFLQDMNFEDDDSED